MSGPATDRRACRGAGALLGVVLLATGCAPRWALRTAAPPISLQWPFQPAAAKITYVRSFDGLAKSGGSGSLLRSFVYGRKDEERDAFALPVAVAVGGDGRVAVADMGRRCVHLHLPLERRYLRLFGTERDAIVSPVGVAFDGELGLYVSDSTGKVLAFDRSGALRFVLRDAGKRPLQRPTGLAYSPTKQLLYVVDTLAHEVHAFRNGGEHAFSFGGRGDGPGAFNFPTHLTRSAAGELFVTDALNFRIAIFDESGTPQGSFGHHGDGSGDLAMPKGVAVDRAGTVYVVDGLFDNVQLFDRKGTFLLTLGKRGLDFGEFWLPSGIFLAADGELYVCDTYNRRIQVFRIEEADGDGPSS